MASSPNSTSRMLRAAEAAWNRQDYQRSMGILEEASRLAPTDPCILLDLGRAWGMRYDYAAAEQCFAKAIRVSGWKPASFIAAGIHCVNFGRYDLAEGYFERALKRDGDSTEALVQLAGICERGHRLAAAGELIDRALRLNGSYTPALLARARLDRQAGRLEQAETLLRSFVGRPDPDVWTQAQGWYELGGILDRQGRYDEAMTAFLEAKALMRPTAARYAAELERSYARVKRNEQTISAGALQSWLEAGRKVSPRRRLAVLCGHPRTGTTLLEQVLDSHPGIVSAEETRIFLTEAYLPLTRRFPVEPESLLDVLNAALPELLCQSRSGYFQATESFLGHSIGERLLLDKNPSLTAFIPAALRIFPDARFLVALRDPRDVCLSCFMQPLSLSVVSSAFLSLEGTVTEYASVMGFWKTIRPRMPDSYLEVRYEGLVSDLEPAARRVLDFLGVPWDARVLNFDEHARRKVVRSPTYADVAKPVFPGAVGRWRNYQKYLEPFLDRLDPLAKAFGYE